MVFDVNLTFLLGESMSILARPHIPVALTLFFSVLGIKFSLPCPSHIFATSLPELADEHTDKSCNGRDRRYPR
jgi:hypothetical protein